MGERIFLSGFKGFDSSNGFVEREGPETQEEVIEKWSDPLLPQSGIT
jgi:hypothetical protein